MSVHLRTQTNSFIKSNTHEPTLKQKSSTLSKLSPGGKILNVHEFQPAVNMIFRPKRYVRPNNFIRQNPSTDRIHLISNTHNQVKSNPSSLQKSLSILKKIKDYIIPTNFSFLGFNKSTKTQTVNQSNPNNSTNQTNQHTSQNLNNISTAFNKTQSAFQQKSKNQLQIDSVSQQSCTIPQLKISSPRRRSNDGSQSSKISSKPPTDRNKNEKQHKKNSNQDLFNSRKSQRSEKSVKSKLSLTIEEKSSKITNPTLNLLKHDHVQGQKIKFVYILGHTIDISSPQHCTIYTLVGNENQIDCICISKTSNQSIIDTDLVWSLTLEKGTNEKGKIASVGFDMMKSTLICMLSNDLKLIEIYRYNPKQLNQRPQHITSIYLSSHIHTFHILKQNHLILVYETKLVEIYAIEGKHQPKKRYQKPLHTQVSFQKNITHPLQILNVGEPLNNTTTIYLSCNASQTSNPLLFDLYIIEITYMGQGETTMTRPHKVYSIKKDLQSALKFDNLSQKFFLLYIGLEVIAVMKEGYMIDSAKVDVQEEKSLLKYVGKNRLLLITQTKIQQYEFILHQNSPPYRLLIKSLDSILLPQNYDPKMYEFFDIAPIFQPVNTQKTLYQQIQFISTYLICFQLKYQLNRKAVTGQVPYMLTITRPVSVHQKAQKLFIFEGRDISKVDLHQIQQKVDIAKKMGLKVKDIYLDLWNRTKKNRVEDFCFLLDTDDYEVISKQIQKKLKKQALFYTEITKIQGSCLAILKKKVTSPQCTELDLKNYIVSHFKLKKYDFFKDVSKFCENELFLREELKKPDPKGRRQSVAVGLKVDDHQNSQKKVNLNEDRRLMFDIQAFYTYNQMQLKSYLLQLFQKYFYQISQTPLTTQQGKKSKTEMTMMGNFRLIWAKKKDYLLKIKIMMNNFRFQLKFIYEQLLEDLIKLTQKGNMITELLNDFDQILPKSFSNELQADNFNVKEEDLQNNLNVSKKFQIAKLKSSLKQSTNGQLQLEGVWREVTEGEYTNYLYLQTVETLYNKNVIQSLSKQLWFKRNLYSQHDFILKTQDQIMQVDKKLKSSYIFYFFIDRVYQIIKDESLRKQVTHMIDENYANVLPRHLRGKVQLYYLLFLQTQKLSKQYTQKLQQQTKNVSRFNINGYSSHVQTEGYSHRLNNNQYSSKPYTNGYNESNSKNNSKIAINRESSPLQTIKTQQKSPIKKSLYEKFLPSKQTHNPNDLESFQNFLKLQQIQLFRQFIKLQYILVGCIFHKIKPIYEKFDKGKEIFNQTVDLYFQSKTSDISHLKCLLNRLNSQSKEFQQAHFQLYEVLIKSVMNKTLIGSQIPQNQYLNVDELIIYIHGIYMANQHHFYKRTLSKSSQLLGININANQKFIKLRKDQSFNQSQNSLIKFDDDSPKTAQSKGSLEAESSTNIAIYFKMLTCLSQNQALFRKLKTRISLYEIYELYKNNKTQKITSLIVEYLIESENLYKFEDYESFEDKTVEILVQAALILDQMFMSKQNFIKKFYHFEEAFMTQSAKTIDNLNYENELFFILFWKIMSHEEYMFNGWVFRLLENKDIARNYLVNEMLKENFVIFMAKYRFSLDKLFVNNIKYLECLIKLLPEKNKIRRYFASQIQLVKAIEPTLEPYHPSLQKYEPLNRQELKPMICNPLTQNSQIISIFHIEEIFSLYPSQYLLKLDLEKIGSIVNEMQEILLEVAVKERLADKQVEEDKNSEKKGDVSIEEFPDKKDDHFAKLEKQNSHGFMQALEKSFNLFNTPKEHQNGSGLFCGTPLYNGACETPVAMSGDNREIILSEIETLIKQSAQPQTFFSNSQAKLIRSLKQMKESRLLGRQGSVEKLGSSQKQANCDTWTQELENLSQYYTGLPQIYEVVIKRLINSEMVKQVIVYLQKLLSLSQTHAQNTNQLHVVYPLLILNIISRELSPQNKFLLVKICSHLFKEPVEMLGFIKELVGNGDGLETSRDGGNSIRYSLKELNQKLLQYERVSRVYKIQYVPLVGKGGQKEFDAKRESEDVGKTGEAKRKLKKKLTITVDSQDELLFMSNNSRKQSSGPQLAQVQYLKRPFSYENPLMLSQWIKAIVSEEEKMKSVEQIWKTFEKLGKEELFAKDFEFMLVSVMLLQEPYTIVKYLETKLKGWAYGSRQIELYGSAGTSSTLCSNMLKFKSILAYFNVMIKQDMLNPLRLLEFSKRMFYMLYSIVIERSSIEYQIREYYDIPLSDVLPCNHFPDDSPLSEVYTAKFRQSIQAISKKIKQLIKKMSPCGRFFNQPYQPIVFNAPEQHGHQRKPSVASVVSPKKSQTVSKENLELLELSYNDIEDSGIENQEFLFLTHNPSKLSHNSKIQQNFDPSKQRQLIKSRGYNRYSAILSTNSYDIRNSLKDKLSPKSSRSGKAPSITVSVSGQRFFGKQSNKYFAAKKQNLFSSKRGKKTYEKMIKCSQSGDEDISYEEENVIYEQDFQISQQLSEEQEVNVQKMIMPPKMYDQSELESMLQSSDESVNLVQRSRNLVVEDLASKNDDREFMLWSYRQAKSKGKKFDFSNSKEESNVVYSPQFMPGKQSSFDQVKYAFKGLNESDKSNQNIISSKTIKNTNRVIMEEDESVHVEIKSQSGCEYVPDNPGKDETIQQHNESLIQIQIASPKNIFLPANHKQPKQQQLNNQYSKSQRQKPYDSQLKQSNPQKPLKNHELKTNTKQPSKKILQSNFQKQTLNQSQTHNKRVPNSNQLSKKDLSNELRKFQQSIENESPPSVTSFKLQSKIQKRQNLVKLQRKQQRTVTKEPQITQPIEKEKVVTEVKIVKPYTRKNLALQISPEPSSTLSDKKQSNIQDYKNIPKMLLSPRQIPKSDPVKEAQLQKRIKSELVQNGIEGFLLTQLEDIYEKFREYWNKCEDIIQNNSPKNQLYESKIRQSSVMNDKKNSSVIRNGKKIVKGPASQSQISLQFSHSQQSFIHDQQSIELFSTHDPLTAKQPQTLFTKQQLYNLIITMLQQKLKERKQHIDTEIFLQQIKDKLFYKTCMIRLVEWYTNEVNFNAIAKIIDLVFKKKIYLTDYYYEVVSTREVQRLEVLVENLHQENQGHSNRQPVKLNHEESRLKNTLKVSSPRMHESSKSNKTSNINNKIISPRGISTKKNTIHVIQTPQKPEQKALNDQIHKVQILLQKIPQNILQFRKKQLMLKLKPGSEGGRKYLLDILVRVFETKKDKKAGQEIYSRLKNLVDKDIK